MRNTYRPLRPSEYSFLKEMLHEALYVPVGAEPFPTDKVEEPELRKYFENWKSKKYDHAFVAVSNGKLVGLVWGRCFSVDNPSYGFVDTSTPEICMAVKGNFRDQGIGTELLNLIEESYEQIEVKQISLSVDKLNPAKKLYDRSGYVEQVEKGTAITMLKILSAPDSIEQPDI